MWKHGGIAKIQQSSNATMKKKFKNFARKTSQVINPFQHNSHSRNPQKKEAKTQIMA